MTRAFIAGFVDELEKAAFFDTKNLKALQRKLKEIQKGLNKQLQIITVPGEGSKKEERPIRPGAALASAKSMAGDVVQKMKNLKPLTRRATMPRIQQAGKGAGRV